MGMTTYKPRDFNLSNLKGISDETLEMHFKLYEGYVKETNKLNEKIAEFIKDAKVDQDEFADYSELNRRAKPVFAKRRKNLSAATIFGRLILSASARCAALVGPSVTRTRRTDSCRIIGSACTRRAMSPVSIRCW